MSGEYQVLEISPKFFINERENAYSDWREAVSRELVQNAYDADSRRVDLNFYQDEDHVVIECEDDGYGMPRERLETVYFSLGESYKDDGSAGGFGRARILMPFSMAKYEIRSYDYRVTGAYARRKIEECEPLPRGFLLRGWTDTATVEELTEKARVFLGECSLENCQVFLNGDLAPSAPALGKQLRELHVNDKRFADVYYNETVGEGYLIVRVKGLSMFKRSTRLDKGTIFVELDVEKSRDALTSNRDGLHFWYDDAVNKFLQEIASETKEALRTRRAPYKKYFKGKGVYRMKPKEATQKDQPLRPALKPAERVKNLVVRGVQAYEESRRVIRTQGSGGGVASAPGTSGEHYSGEEAPPEDTIKVEVSSTGKKLYSAADFLADIPIYVDHGSNEVLKLVDRYDPSNWKFTIHGDKPVWQNCHFELHLLLAWQEAVRAALDTLYSSDKLAPKHETAYTVGWMFKDTSLARLENLGSVHAFYLNPLTNDGKRRFDLRKKQHVQMVCSEAIHEAAHLVASYHNDWFATVQTELAGLFPWEPVMKSIMGIKF